MQTTVTACVYVWVKHITATHACHQQAELTKLRPLRLQQLAGVHSCWPCPQQLTTTTTMSSTVAAASASQWLDGTWPLRRVRAVFVRGSSSTVTGCVDTAAERRRAAHGKRSQTRRALSLPRSSPDRRHLLHTQLKSVYRVTRQASEQRQIHEITINSWRH